MGTKGNNSKSWVLWEELEHLRVSPESGAVSIYKRQDPHLTQATEKRPYQIHIPVPDTKGGIRKSLKTPDRETAISKAEEMVLEVKVQLRQGGSVVALPVEELVKRFLKYKEARIRGEWDSKQDAGLRSITQERYGLIAGKLRNYLVPFLGAKTDARGVPFSKWKQWEEWRYLHNSRSTSRPKAITIQNEMGMIRECWKWAMENSLIAFTPKLPFHDENLITDDKVRRDTWEAKEWSSFARRVREWLKEQRQQDPETYWDAFVAYQMLFFLANNGMRVGELSKVKRKDIQFYERDEEDAPQHKRFCALVQVHPSTKTGAREVNSMGGEFAKRVWDKSSHKRKEDFLFCHLDGSQFTTRQFGTIFKRIIKFVGEEERTGKRLVPYSLRHLYATTRLQNGTSKQALCENMGVSEPYLRKHYSHFLTRLATADLMRMRNDIGLRGELKEGGDFTIPDYA